jgi:hypothetical protein
MMVVPDLGAVELLEQAFRSALAVDVPLSVRLYSNNYTPDDDSVLGDFTESGWLGYFRETVNRNGWNAALVVAGMAAITYATVFEWTNTSGSDATVYGYYVVNPATAAVQFAERFGTPRVVAAGAKLQLQLVVTGTYQV